MVGNIDFENKIGIKDSETYQRAGCLGNLIIIFARNDLGFITGFIIDDTYWKFVDKKIVYEKSGLSRH